MSQHYTDEDLIEILGDNTSASLPHLDICPSCAQRAKEVRGLLTAMDAWTIDDHDALVGELDAAATNVEPLESRPLQHAAPPASAVGLSEEIFSLLQQIYPVECEILMPPILMEISQGRPAAEFVSGGGGAYTGISDVLLDTIAAAAMLRAMLSLRAELATMVREGEATNQVTQRRKQRLAEIAAAYSNVPADSRAAAVNLIFAGSV